MHSLFWYVHILIKSLFFFLALRIKHNFGKETRLEEKVATREKRKLYDLFNKLELGSGGSGL